MSQVHVSRFLDAGVMGMFLMFISGAFLYMLSQFWEMVQGPAFAQWKLGPIVRSILPFPKRFEFNLSHVLLLAIIICLLSIRSSETNPSEKKRSSKQRDKKSYSHSTSETTS